MKTLIAVPCILAALAGASPAWSAPHAIKRTCYPPEYFENVARAAQLEPLLSLGDPETGIATTVWMDHEGGEWLIAWSKPGIPTCVKDMGKGYAQPEGEGA